MISNPRLLLRKSFTFCSILFSRLSKFTYRSPQEREVDRWLSDNGDATLRVDYDLNKDSVVFDLGGYEGDWAAEISARYGSHIFVFEPVPEYVERIEKRFKRNSNVQVFSYGLGAENMTQTISLAEEGSSLFKSPNVSIGSKEIPIRIKRAADVLPELLRGDIDLMKINIEGGEYDLIEHLIQTGLVSRIANIQVQFHGFVPYAESRRKKIQTELAKTHSQTYEYKFVWENWVKKGECK